MQPQGRTTLVPLTADKEGASMRVGDDASTNLYEYAVLSVRRVQIQMGHTVSIGLDLT